MRRDLPEAISRRTQAMYDLLRTSHGHGNEPWSTMFTSGHGDHWKAISRYVGAHRHIWTGALVRVLNPENGQLWYPEAG